MVGTGNPLVGTHCGNMVGIGICKFVKKKSSKKIIKNKFLKMKLRTIYQY
jgi:hypothetical protein